MPNIRQRPREELGNFTKMLPQQWIVFTGLPISCVGVMAVLAVMLKHTMADIQVTSLPPLWQSFTKMLILLGSNLTVVYIRTTLCDLWRHKGVLDEACLLYFQQQYPLLGEILTKGEQQHQEIQLPDPPNHHYSYPSCHGYCGQNTAGQEPNLLLLPSEEQTEEEKKSE